MKRQTFKTALFLSVFIILLSVLLFTACSETSKTWGDKPNIFIVEEVLQRKGQVPQITTYKVIMYDNTSLGATAFWFADSVHKYVVGDTLIIKKQDR